MKQNKPTMIAKPRIIKLALLLTSGSDGRFIFACKKNGLCYQTGNKIRCIGKMNVVREQNTMLAIVQVDLSPFFHHLSSTNMRRPRRRRYCRLLLLFFSNFKGTSCECRAGESFFFKKRQKGQYVTRRIFFLTSDNNVSFCSLPHFLTPSLYCDTS